MLLQHLALTLRSLTPANAACWSFPADFLNSVLDKDTGQFMEMQHLLANPKYKDLWGKLYTTVLARLAQDIPGVSKGTNTIVFIKRNKVLIDWQKDTTYGCVCINYCPEKENPNCTHLTVRKNLLNFPGDCGTPTVNMVTIKLHLNSVISTKGDATVPLTSRISTSILPLHSWNTWE